MERKLALLFALLVLGVVTVVVSAQSPQDTPTLLGFYIDDINKATQAVDQFTPAGSIYLVNAVGGQWLLIAISPKAKEKWLAKDPNFAAWDKANPGNTFELALQVLAASGAKKIPTYKPNPKNMAFHNGAEEKLMFNKFTNPGNITVFKSGLTHSTWQIETNALGIPKDRYKWGLIWAKNSAVDFPYCELYHVNVIQDYAGGGTYGETYAKIVSHELVGCQ